LKRVTVQAVGQEFANGRGQSKICPGNFYSDPNMRHYYASVEAQIREAIERGDFDNLPNKGKPLDLSEWEKTPQHLRMSYSILKNAGYSPREVHTKQEIAELRAMLEAESDDERKARLLQKLNALSITDALNRERGQMEKLRKKR